MRGSKFIDLLRQLSPRERARFGEMAESPFFNKNQKLRRLIGYCLQQAPAFQEQRLEKKDVFHLVYGAAAPYNELQINNLLSDALQLLYQLLVQLELQGEPIKQKQYELRALLLRRADKHLRHSSNRLSKLTEQAPNRSQDYFQRQLEEALLLDRRSLQQSPRRQSPHLQNASNALDRYYCCHKMRIACDMASRNKAVNAAYECHFIAEVLSMFRSAAPHLRGQPSLQTYYEALMMLTSEQEQHYRALRQLLQKHGSLLTAEEQQDLYDYAQNYCVKKINSGDAAYYRDILELYKLMLEQGVLFRQGYLTQWSYINIVTAGIRLQEFEWTRAFIHDYRELLAPDVQENVFTYNLAALQFEQGHYKAALQTLQGVEFSDAFYHMAAKIIQLKSYYELEETEALFSLLEASRKYIKRNRQLSAYQKQSNNNFLRIITKLHKLQLQQPRLSNFEYLSALSNLQRELEALQAVANKGWLRKKMAV